MSMRVEYLEKRVASLIAKLDEAEEENRQLREGASSTSSLDYDLLPVNLPPVEAQIILILAGARRGKWVSKNDLVYELFCERGTDSTSANLRVRICNLRKRLTPHGYEIENSKGKGYRLSESSHSRILEFMESKSTPE
jgi:DNA-binding winged helix-turn-helix (wHTH) protein